jgi:hypothetical protein
MSTKTSFKRIALVAVASLGLGLMSAAPSNAAALEITSTVVATSPTVATTLATPAAQGSTITATINFIQAAVSTTATHTITTTYVITDPNGTVVTPDATFTSVAGAVGGVTTTNVAGVYTHSVAVGATAATKAVGTVTFPAKTAGRYVISYSTANTTLATDTNTLITAGTVAGNVYISGAGAVVASSGIGTTTIGAVSGGIARVRFGTDAHTASTVYNLISSGVGTIQTVGAGTLDADSRVGIAGTSDFTQGARITTDADTTFNDVIATVASNVAGTQTLTFTKIDATTGNPTVVATQAITWGAAPALAATNSAAWIQAGVGANSASADATVNVSRSAGDVANIRVELKDGNGNALNGQKITVTIDGPGLIGVDVNSVDGVAAARANRIYADSSANAGNVWQIGIASDGVAGVGRYTISVGTSVIAVKSVTFFGPIAKLTATSALIATANGTGTTDAVVVCAADAAGNPVPNATIFATSGDASVASVSGSATTVAAAVTEDVDGPGATTTLSPTAYVAAKAIGCAGFTVTGASQTIKDAVTLTFRDAATAADATATTTLSQKVGSTTASAVTVGFDKASYTAGSKATITLTFKDSVGRLIGASAGAGSLDAALTSSAALQGAALFAANNNLKQGVATADVYMPYFVGTVTITGLTGQGASLATAGRGLALTASANVTDAANSTSAQLASLISKINALQKLIAKIQKRLGVK